MSAHTPWPWHYMAGNGFLSPAVQRGQAGGSVIRGGISREQDEADARLISAAPDMLDVIAAIRLALAAGFGDDLLAENSPIREDLDAAFRKATGAQP